MRTSKSRVAQALTARSPAALGDHRESRLGELPEDSCCAIASDNPDDALAAREALRILAGLPERQRRYPALKVSGHSDVEIRTVTGATYTNVNRHLCRVRARIRAARAA
jgi:DNA-directed RNA polymerase specialized sigma24 family protein